MLKSAVIGDPVEHSLSPAMQNAGLQALGLEGSYVKIHVRKEGIADFVEYAKRELNGFNITVPHKGAIIPFLDSIAPAAKLAGSVNTVTIRNGRLHGESTDGYGLETAIFEAFRYPAANGIFTFLGCGGAAHAASFHFAAKGAREIRFINRTAASAELTAKAISKHFPNTKTSVLALSETEKLHDFIAGSGVLIQCTSLGLKAADPAPMDPALLPDGIAVYDTIYRKTAMLKGAEARGLACANGLGMLLHQGARSLEIWTGRPAPVEAMREALVSAWNEQIN